MGKKEILFFKRKGWINNLFYLDEIIIFWKNRILIFKGRNFNLYNFRFREMKISFSRRKLSSFFISFLNKIFYFLWKGKFFFLKEKKYNLIFFKSKTLFFKRAWGPSNFCFGEKEVYLFKDAFFGNRNFLF